MRSIVKAGSIIQCPNGVDDFEPLQGHKFSESDLLECLECGKHFGGFSWGEAFPWIKYA